MEFFNEAKEKIKSVKKNLKAIKIVGGILSGCAPVFMFAILFLFFLSPLLLFIDKTASIFNDDGSQNNKKTFESAILKKEEHYNGDPYHVQIDKELILAFLLYGRGYAFEEDYSINHETAEDGSTIDCDLDNPDNCYGDDSLIPAGERRKLSRYANYLADGMVKKYYEYTCTHYEMEDVEKCDDEAMNYRNPFVPSTYLLRYIPEDGGSTTPSKGSNCRTVQERKDIYTNYCGESPSNQEEQLCDGVCEEDMDVDIETKYGLKTKDEFITWLKLSQFEMDEYGDWGYNLKEKLEELEITFPPGEEGEEKLDEIIEEIYSYYETIKRSTDPDGGGGGYGDIEDPYSGDYTQWSQKDPAWAGIPLGSGGYTIGSAGCLATSVAIQIKRSGTYINYDYLGSKDFNPGTFVLRLNQTSGFIGSSWVWDSPGLRGIAPNFRYQGMVNLPGSRDGKLSEIYSLLSDSRNFLILSVKSGGHYVAVTGISGDDIRIIDPGGYAEHVRGAFATYNVAGVNKVYIYRKLD